MAHAKHTPGPWTYEGDHTHRQFNIRMLGHLIGTRDEAKHICTVNNLPSHVLANRDHVTAEANARLIAAAPDMLTALDAIVAKAHEYGNRSDTPDNAACGFYDIIEDARAAIAKATGQPAP